MTGRSMHLRTVPAGSAADTAEHRGLGSRGRGVEQLAAFVGAAAGAEGRVPGGHRRPRRLRYRAARHWCALASRPQVRMSLRYPLSDASTVAMRAGLGRSALTKRKRENVVFSAACHVPMQACHAAGGGTVVTPLLAAAGGMPQAAVLGTALLAMLPPSAVSDSAIGDRHDAS